MLKGVLEKLGFADGGGVGEKLSFAEQVEREQSKAAERAVRMKTREGKAKRESDARFKAAKQIGDFIPFGQPILVGHHSEKRHRRDIERIDNNMRKSIEADEKAEYYANKVENAEYTASGAKFKNVKYLVNRIGECNKCLRSIDKIETRFKLNNPNEESEIRINGLVKIEAKRAEWIDKLDFFKTKLQEIGGGQMTAERLKEAKPKYVKVRGEWWPLKSINRDTVTVLNWLNIAHFTWRFKFDLITSIEAGYVTVVHDRDGNEVKPIIKYK